MTIHSDVSDLQGIQFFTNLKVLLCSDVGLISLKGIENLITFYCDNNKLKNVGELYNLTNVISFDCSHNQLLFLRELKKLARLENLYCYNNSLVSLDGITKKHHNLNFFVLPNEIPVMEIQKIEKYGIACKTQDEIKKLDLVSK